MAQQADEVDVESGYQLVREGEFAYEFFAIEEGTAEVRRGEQHLAELGPGDFFGEMGLIENAPRNASVTASSPLTAVVMTGSPFARSTASCRRWPCRSARRSTSAAATWRPSSSSSGGRQGSRCQSGKMSSLRLFVTRTMSEPSIAMV